MAYRGNLKRRMERANRTGARAAVILGDDDIADGVAQVKDLATGAQEAVPLLPHPVPPAMNLALKLDRIAARAEELRAMLSEGISGEAYVKASKELSDIEPVVARIGDLRAAERARDEAETLLADPEMKDLAEAELYRTERADPGAGARNPSGAAAQGRGGRALRDPGNPPRRRRRRGRLVRRRTVRDVPEIRRRQRLAVRDPGLWRHRPGRDQGGHRRNHRPQRLRPAEIRVRRASRAARARRPKARAASTPRPSPSRCCRKPRKSTSRSTRATCASTSIARRAPAASTSTRPTARCGSPISLPASWWRCRRNAASTRTAPRR